MRKLFVMLMALTAVACSGGGGSGGGASTGGGGNVGDGGAGGSFSDIASASNGWLGVCKQGIGTQTRDILKVEGNKITISTGFFSDASNCDPNTLFRVDKSTFSVQTSGDAFVANATNLNLTWVKEERMATGGHENDFNTESKCGFNDWQADVYKDVSNTSCGNAGFVFYTVFRVLSGNTLYLGDYSGVNDGSTPAKRTDSLDTTKPFVKQ